MSLDEWSGGSPIMPTHNSRSPASCDSASIGGQITRQFTLVSEIDRSPAEGIEDGRPIERAGQWKHSSGQTDELNRPTDLIRASIQANGDQTHHLSSVRASKQTRDARSKVEAAKMANHFHFGPIGFSSSSRPIESWNSSRLGSAECLQLRSKV